MNSIESLTVDYNSQISQLGKINNDKISDNLVFVGSGDSYVAALIEEYLTNHKCKCYSPSDLFNSGLAKDRTCCFISLTGKTKANISVAKLASERGSKTIAVTLDRNSKLAEVCTKVIPLKITKVNTPNAGFSTFVANVVTCLQIAGIDVPIKFDTWHDRAIELSLKLLDTVKLPAERVHLLGNNMLYAVALYASFQLAEFFGTAAVSHKLEEFCHSPVFSLKKSDNI